MERLLEGIGLGFGIPLLICSVLAMFVIVERLIALRSSRVIPKSVVPHFVNGEVDQVPESEQTVIGRILRFYRQSTHDHDALKSFAALETARLERGMFVLEIVVAAAPLIGLLGTVTGLIRVFNGIDPASGMPDPSMFMVGIAQALGTTMLGLTVAIPALIANGYLYRRIDWFTAQIDLVVERLIDIANNANAKA